MFRTKLALMTILLMSSMTLFTRATVRCHYKEQTNGIYTTGKGTITSCGPTNLKVYDSKEGVVMTLKGASHYYWHHQFRLVHFLFWLRPIKLNRWDNSKLGIFLTDLRTQKTEQVVDGENIVEYLVSADANKMALFTTTEFSILSLAPKKSQLYLTKFRPLKQSNVLFSHSRVQILGWSKDNNDFWFYAYDEAPNFTIYRWRANAITPFYSLREFYLPDQYTRFRIDSYFDQQQRQFFNPTYGLILHFKKGEKHKLFLTDLIHEKTVFVDMALPGTFEFPIPKWTGDTTFSYQKENGAIATGDALALLGLPREGTATGLKFWTIVSATGGVVFLVVLLFVVTLLLRRRRNAA